MLALTLLLILPFTASDVQVCGVGSPGETYHRDRLAETERSLRTPLITEEASSLRLEDGLVIMTADERTARGWKRFDLAGQALHFRPNPAGGYSVSRSSAETKPRGLRFDPGGKWAARYTIASFEFPFGLDKVRDLYIAPVSIHLQPFEPDRELFQFTAEEALAVGGVIAPFLTTPRALVWTPVIYVRETSESVAITWVASGYEVYEVRAELFHDGAIEFAYMKADQPPFGHVAIVTTGKEFWRNESTVIGSAMDTLGDTRDNDSLSRMLDIRSARASRNATGRIRFELELAQDIDFSRIPDGSEVSIEFAADSFYLVSFDRNGITRLQVPPGIPDAVSIKGNAITFDILETRLRMDDDSSVHFWTSLRRGANGISVDELGLTLPRIDPLLVETDFSAVAAQGSVLSGPVVEVFTVPSLSESDVWEAVKNAYGLRDDDWDSVAIYQNFDTDLVIWAAGTSVGGNPMVSGIGLDGFGSSLSPSLVNAGRITRNPSMQLPYANLLLHEFGHRFLFYVEYQEGGQNSRGLLDSWRSHPHQLVDTRAAFPIGDETRDFSVMGGRRIAEKDGIFHLGTAWPATGYSWLDLYLMGLADPAEVPPFFYVADPIWVDVAAYRGRRVDVTLSQIISAMGPRQPSYPATDHNFNVAFVLLTDPTRPATPAEIALVKQYRAQFEKDFRVATGGRGSVTTHILGSPKKRRSARH